MNLVLMGISLWVGINAGIKVYNLSLKKLNDKLLIGGN